MHAYRTHKCAELRSTDVGTTVRLSGWIHRRRDHGGVLFIDLRDHYGITQIVADEDNPVQKLLDSLKLESVVTVTGEVVARSAEAVNPKLPTGEIEVVARCPHRDTGRLTVDANLERLFDGELIDDRAPPTLVPLDHLC